MAVDPGLGFPVQWGKCPVATSSDVFPELMLIGAVLITVELGLRRTTGRMRHSDAGGGVSGFFIDD